MTTDFVKENTLNKNVSQQHEALAAIRAPKNDRLGDSSLKQYMYYVNKKEPLSAEEELLVTKHIAKLEQALWFYVLSNENVFRRIIKVILSSIESSKNRNDTAEVVHLLKTAEARLKKKQAVKAKARKMAALTEELSGRLFTIDIDRILIGKVLEEVYRLEAVHSVENSEELSAFAKTVKQMAAQIKETKNRFITDNLHLVVRVARHYYVDEMPMSDLVQEGNIGLIKAVDRYDFNKGYRFASYAVWWIRCTISRALAEKARTVRVPEYTQRARSRLKKAEERIRVKTGQSISEGELAGKIGVSEKQVNWTKKYGDMAIDSLDQDSGSSENIKNIDLLLDDNAKSPFDETNLRMWSNNISNVLTDLDSVERAVINLRFGLSDGEEMTLQEIGDILGRSRERIRQIQNTALNKLRNSLDVNAA